MIDRETKHCHEVIIATAALLGGVPVYYDYGHPERARCRQYWTISPLVRHPMGNYTIFGYTREECAMKWLQVVHPEIKLPWR